MPSQPVSINIENVQPLHHPNQTAAQLGNHQGMPQGHSEMGGKALLAKKMAASGYVWKSLGVTDMAMLTDPSTRSSLPRQSFYSPTDTMVSPCTAKLHLAKKKHFNKLVA